jgi:uncharacterized iron-regulated protein
MRRVHWKLALECKAEQQIARRGVTGTVMANPWSRRLAGALVLLVTSIAGISTAHSEIAARAGLIWDVAAAAPISREALDQRIAATTYILLGEKHDNAHHHRLQGEILNRLLEAGRRPVLVWEMLPRSLQPKIDAYASNKDASADGFAEAVGWTGLGWGAWSLFRPIAEAALAGGARQRAGGLDRADLKAVGRGGMKALPKDLAARLPEGEPLSPAQRKIIEDAVFDGHCGYVPRAHLGPMISVQIARDLALANALTHPPAPDGAVLIAGAQHVRRDAGAPVHLVRMRPSASILAIGFIETGPDRRPDPLELARTSGHDILWFTAPGPDKDYCADLAKRFGLKGKPARVKSKSQ